MPRLESNLHVRSFLQAIEAVNRGHVTAKDKLYQLKALQEAGKKIEVSESKKTWEQLCAPFLHSHLK